MKSLNYGAYGDVIGEEAKVMRTGLRSDSSMPEVFAGAYGIRRDTTTGLDYMRFRWYANDLSSFISADRVRGTNRYAYAKGNPVKYVDPMGLKETNIEEPQYIINPVLTIDYYINFIPNNSIPPEPIIGYISSDNLIYPVTQYMQNDSFYPIKIFNKNNIYYNKFHWTYLPYRNSFGEEISNLINCAGFAAGVEGKLATSSLRRIIESTSFRVENCKKQEYRQGQIVVSSNWGHYGVVVNDNGKFKVIFTDASSAVFVVPIEKYLEFYDNSEIWQPVKPVVYNDVNMVPQGTITPGQNAVFFFHHNRMKR